MPKAPHPRAVARRTHPPCGLDDSSYKQRARLKGKRGGGVKEIDVVRGAGLRDEGSCEEVRIAKISREVARNLPIDDGVELGAEVGGVGAVVGARDGAGNAVGGVVDVLPT